MSVCSALPHTLPSSQPRCSFTSYLPSPFVKQVAREAQKKTFPGPIQGRTGPPVVIQQARRLCCGLTTEAPSSTSTTTLATSSLRAGTALHLPSQFHSPCFRAQLPIISTAIGTKLQPSRPLKTQDLGAFAAELSQDMSIINTCKS